VASISKSLAQRNKSRGGGKGDKEAFGLTQCSAELGRTTSHSALLTCPGVNGWGLFRRLDAASPV
jgi:hypothetical protein